MVDKDSDVRIVGVITVTILLLISMAGMEWESKVSTSCAFYVCALMLQKSCYV